MIFTYSGNTLELDNPRYGYQSVIDLAIDISKGSNGENILYDNGSQHDRYRCTCSFKLDRDKYNEAVIFFSTYTETLSLSLSSGSGFYPFSPFREDGGTHNVVVTSFYGDEYSNTYRTRNLTITFQKVGTGFQSFTGAGDQNGCITIGLVTGISQGSTFTETHDERILSSDSRTIYKSYNNGYSTGFPLEINDRTNKTGEIIEEILRLRDEDILLEYPSYKLGQSVSVLTKLNNSEIVVTHNSYDKFTTSFELLYASRVYS